MAGGKIPYLDFCFPQTPLNAYWNAGWMRLLGFYWRVPHAFAALFTIGAAGLTARFVLLRFPVASWRGAAALSALLLTGLNAMVFIFGPLQAYGISLFMLVAAFRMAVREVDREGWRGTAAVGFLAGTAAASTLLSAAAAPVLIFVDAVLQSRGRPVGEAGDIRGRGGGAVCSGDVAGGEGAAADVVQSGSNITRPFASCIGLILRAMTWKF